MRLQLMKVHGYRHLPANLLAVFRSARASLPVGQRKILETVLMTLECFLAITGKALDLVFKNRIRVGNAFELFIGALYSEKFVSLSMGNRYLLASTWINLCDKFSVDAVDYGSADVKVYDKTEYVSHWVCGFEKLTLVRKEVSFWRQRGVVNSNGEIIWIDITPLFHKYGIRFAEALHLTIREYHIKQTHQQIPFIKDFIAFISDPEKSFKASDLKDSSKTAIILREFCGFVIRKNENKVNYSGLKRIWDQFRFLMINHICEAGLVAHPAGGFVILPSTGMPIAHTSKTADGGYIHTKLLVDVPLHVPSAQVISEIRRDLRKTLEMVDTWTRSEINNIWSRYVAREEAASRGIFRPTNSDGTLGGSSIKPSFADNSWFENASANFKAYGFVPAQLFRRTKILYPVPLGETAGLLGLPTHGALLPHAAFLVAQHNQITPAFLEDLEIFDESGKIDSLVEVDEKHIIRGFKLRRGKKLAQQTLTLTEQAAIVVHQVLMLTQPLRDWLRGQGNPLWRRLFLSSGEGFTKPSPVHFSALTSNPGDVQSLAESFESALNIERSTARSLAERFSLVSLRASSAIEGFFDNPDEAALSATLGHAAFSPKLLDRYLPPPIRAYFRQRSIRLYQSAIICEAMKDSRHLLRAAAFESAVELEEFLLHSALRVKPQDLIDADKKLSSKQDDGKVLVAVNVQNLLVYMELEAKRLAKPNDMVQEEIEWAQFGQRVISEIRNSSTSREELSELLVKAEHEFSKINEIV